MPSYFLPALFLILFLPVKLRWRLLLLAFSFCVGGAVNMSGLCFAKGRLLTSDEHINIAIEEIRESQNAIHLIDWKNPQSLKLSLPENVKYKSISEFKEKNPNCCTYIPAERYYKEGGSRLDTVTRFLAPGSGGIVTINYRNFNFKTDGRLYSELVTKEVYQTNCGAEWND